MTKLCFIDTETTSLRHDRRAWEIGLIVRRPDEADFEVHRFVTPQDLDLGNADLGSLNIGRYFERHPAARGDFQKPPGAEIVSEAAAMAEVAWLTRGAHLAGAVPNFDTEVLAARMRAHGICPAWHYHLIDVETLAVGYLAGRGWPLDHHGDSEGKTARMLDPRDLPWNSDALSAALGIVVSDEDRHTALGDARWARAIYDAVMK